MSCTALRAGVAAAAGVPEGVATVEAIEQLALHVGRVARDEPVRAVGAGVEAGVAAQELAAARSGCAGVPLERGDVVDRADRVRGARGGHPAGEGSGVGLGVR